MPNQFSSFKSPNRLTTMTCCRGIDPFNLSISFDHVSLWWTKYFGCPNVSKRLYCPNSCYPMLYPIHAGFAYIDNMHELCTKQAKCVATVFYFQVPNVSGVNLDV